MFDFSKFDTSSLISACVRARRVVREGRPSPLRDRAAVRLRDIERELRVRIPPVLG